MKGIADGAAAAGAKFDGRPIDLLDIVALNCEIEIDMLDAALRATPTGLEGKTFKEPQYDKPAAQEGPLLRLRRHRPGHGGRQDRLRPHHHVRPVPGEPLQRLARRQAGERATASSCRPSPAASRAAWTTT